MPASLAKRRDAAYYAVIQGRLSPNKGCETRSESGNLLNRQGKGSTLDGETPSFRGRDYDPVPAPPIPPSGTVGCATRPIGRDR